MADYKMEGLVYELNVASAKLAREAIDEVRKQDPSRVCFVAALLGPPTAPRPCPRTSMTPVTVP